MDASLFLESLDKAGVNFFTGVPDSYLHGFCCELKSTCSLEKNIIAANEGNAIGIAVGHYLATSEVPLVYMQNSGLGNAVNPLASLACNGMLGVPMILLIGWRGDPWHDDHIQHELQGEITPKTLDIMGIPRITLCSENFNEAVEWAVTTAITEETPVGILVPKGLLNGKKKPSDNNGFFLSREQAISIVLDAAPPDAIYSATTGRASRELFHLRETRGEGHDRDYLNVGSMGHASSVTLGMALARPERHFVCLDGDAAVIMHMGALTMPSKIGAPNFLHVVLNNGEHESVGGQPSAGYTANLTAIAAASGYQTYGRFVSELDEVSYAVKKLCSCGRAAFLDIHIHSGIRSDMPGLDINPKSMRNSLISSLCTYN